MRLTWQIRFFLKKNALLLLDDNFLQERLHQFFSEVTSSFHSYHNTESSIHTIFLFKVIHCEFPIDFGIIF